MSPRHRRALLGLPVLLAIYGWMVHRFWFLCDDAFITFRYSRNWAQGHGPRYNLGEHVPVEGYSNFLWMAIAAAVDALGGDMRVVMPWLSVAAGALTLALVYRTLLVHLRASLPVAWSATLMLAVFPPFAVWSTSGLATMPQTLFMLATWWLLAVSRDERGPVLAGMTALLLALIRTEGVAWVVVIGGLGAAQRLAEGRDVRKALAAYLGLSLSGYAVYYGWRWSYYDSLFANTAYAKVHMTPATLVRGVQYVAYYAATMVTPLLVLPAIPLALRGTRPPMVATAALLALGVPAYAVAVSGDYMTYFRILVPGTPFLALVLGAAAASWELREPSRMVRGAMMLTIIAAWGTLPAFDLHLVPESVRSELQVRDKLDFFRDENGQWTSMARHTDTWRDKGEALAAYAKPGQTYVAAAIGNVGFYSGLFIYDRNGLVTREVAMQPWSGELRSPGHDKTVDYTFFLDRKPDILDAKLEEGRNLQTRVRGAVREMDGPAVRDSYYPVIFELPKRGRNRRVLVPLQRAASPEDAEAGWERYRIDLEALGGR